MEVVNNLATKATDLLGCNNPKVAGDAVPLKDTILETGAGLVQSFSPVRNICAHLHAYHVPFHHSPSQQKNEAVPAHHYCSHVTSSIRQCLLYDSDQPNARLIGVEYMITPELYTTLSTSERKLWHSHVFEVKSGMLIMPISTNVKSAIDAWEVAETKEMEEVVKLYGKVYHLWQEGDAIPLGEPRLMTSFTEKEQWNEMEETLDTRDEAMGVLWREKAKKREGVEIPKLHDDVDSAWKK